MIAEPIPDGYHTVTPYLVVRDPAGLIEFLTRAFGATELSRTTLPDGTLVNAEIRIGDSMVLMGQARGGFEPMPAMIYLYVPDTDAVYRRAVEAGGVSLIEPQDMYYGDRNAGVKDPEGNQWWIATRVEKLSPEEIQKRAAAREQREAKPTEELDA